MTIPPNIKSGGKCQIIEEAAQYKKHVIARRLQRADVAISARMFHTPM